MARRQGHGLNCRVYNLSCVLYTSLRYRKCHRCSSTIIRRSTQSNHDHTLKPPAHQHHLPPTLRSTAPSHPIQRLPRLHLYQTHYKHNFTRPYHLSRLRPLPRRYNPLPPQSQYSSFSGPHYTPTISVPFSLDQHYAVCPATRQSYTTRRSV